MHLAVWRPVRWHHCVAHGDFCTMVLLFLLHVEAGQIFQAMPALVLAESGCLVVALKHADIVRCIPKPQPVYCSICCSNVFGRES